MHLDLTTPKPFKSSHLALPPSPFSPQFPITPPATPPQKSKVIGVGAAGALRNLEFLPPPPPPLEPLHWLWQCHLCNRCYRLGVTRRCLDDGHYFCSGITTVKRSSKKTSSKRKLVRHKACASEFDYQAWKAWGDWRRGIVEQVQAAAALERLLDGDAVEIRLPGIAVADSWMAGGDGRMLKGRKDCWNRCDYPSECRWGRQEAVETPPVHSPTVMEPKSEPPPMTFDEIVSILQTENHTPTDVFASSAPRTPLTSPDEETKKTSMDDLLSSATRRRKRRSTGLVASPLASNPPSHTTSVTAEEEHVASAAGAPSTAQVLQKALDDFELDFRKSFGKAASAFVSSVVSRRHSAATGTGTALEEDKIGYKGLRGGRRKSAAGFS